MKPRHPTITPGSPQDNSSSEIHKVAIVRCTSYDPGQLRECITHGLNLIDGTTCVVQPRERILLKPNLFAAMRPDRGLTTHPEFVRVVCQILDESGALVSVGDNPVFGFKALTYRRTGMTKALSGMKGRLVFLNDTVARNSFRGRTSRRFLLPRDLSCFDRIISLPKLKTHQLMGLTGAVKNSYGLVHGRGERKRLHLRYPDPDDFARMLLDLDALVRPDLFIVDAVIASDGNGPRWGSTKKVNHIVLGTDAVAVDFVLAAMVGIPVARVGTLRIAQRERGWSDPFSRIQVLGVSLDEAHCKTFDLPPTQGGFVNALPRTIREALIRHSKRSQT